MAKNNLTDRRRPTAAVLQLVPRTENRALVDVVEGLLVAARSGAMTGLVFGASFLGQRFYVDSCGALYRNPVTALGVCAMLTTEIERRAPENGD